MEKLLIICEKNSAAKNFATALGGMNGFFEGDEYQIVHLRGHILKLPEPKLAAFSNYSEFIGDFSKVDSAPWKFSYFNFEERVPNDNDKFINETLTNISNYLNKGYIPVIATDLDEFCEGDLIGYEVLKYCKYVGKIYREKHLDETPSKLRKALSEKEVITYSYVNFIVAKSRAASDFLTQCYTRVASDLVRKQGYVFNGAIPVGRLKSSIIVIIGNQIKAIEDYRPSSVFEHRYKLGSLILTSDEVIQYKTIDEANSANVTFPDKVKIRKVGARPGTTPPPKPLTIDDLTALLSKKNISINDVKNTYQAMYDRGILSYPRTSDNFISHGQFEEALPHIDTYINLLGLNSSLFTHRTPRKTHVKEGGSHGALRPGENIPSSLEALLEFGSLGVEIYKLVTERFLMMFLEDTEWVKHDYVSESNPVFKGSVKVVTKQGVVDSNEKEDDSVVVELPDINKLAELYVHELKSVKPADPKVPWVIDQLKKYNVGTPATRTSTLGELIGNESKPLMSGKKGVLELTKIGLLGYVTAQETIIGSVNGTKKLQDMLFMLAKNEISVAKFEATFEKVIERDIEIIRNKVFNLEAYGFSRDRLMVNFEGQDWSFRNSYGNYKFTQDDLKKLSSGNSISFDTKDKFGSNFRITGKLGFKTSEKTSNKYLDFIVSEAVNLDRHYGVWEGKQVSFKKTYGTHVFTDEEVSKLWKGETIVFVNNGKEITGQLGYGQVEGKTYFGFIGKYYNNDRVKGTWLGREVSISKKWGSHIFTDVEIKKLLNDETIMFDYKNQRGFISKVTGKLNESTWNGKKVVKFEPNFNR